MKGLLAPGPRLDGDGGERKRQLFQPRLRNVPPDEEIHRRRRPDRGECGRGELDPRADEPVEPGQSLARVERTDEAAGAHADDEVDRDPAFLEPPQERDVAEPPGRTAAE